MSTDPSRREVVDPPSALARGTRLGEFEVLRVLGVGGFGIVYLAFDHALEREVAVKEYMPASLAGRTETQHVSLRSQSDADTFALGLRSFVNEGRMLARFDHPSLLKVHRFWEANGTAYMAMPVYRGRTIKEVRAAMQATPDEALLRSLLEPLLGAIEKLHNEGVYHRDIAPDNIVLEPDGRPVLLDFGAARRVISDKSQALTAILKPAYAPIEQYAEAGSVKQGPWTDIYALGATMHYMLLGRPPSPATARAIHDDQVPLSGQAMAGCSENFLHIIDWMLAPRPIDRPQSVAALRDVLEGRAAPPVRRVAPAVQQADWEQTIVVAPGAVPRTQVQWPPPTMTQDQPTMVVPPPRTSAAPPPPPIPTPAASPPAPVASPPPPAPPVAPPPPMAPPLPRPPVVATFDEPADASSAVPTWLLPALLAVMVVAAAAAGYYFLWPKPAAEPSVELAAPAPLPAASAATEPPAAAPETAASAVAASPVAAAPSAAASSAADVLAGPAKPAVAVDPKASARLTTTRAAAAAASARAAEAAELAARQAAEPPKPAPTHPVAVAPPPKPAEPAPVAAAPQASPSERCGSRVLLALWICIERECGKPELHQHAECVKWRADQEQKANPMR